MTDSYLPTDQVEQIAGSKLARVEKNASMCTCVIRMNNAKPPFDNINARKCFAHAFNYKGFIEDILKGYADRDGTPTPNTLWASRRTPPASDVIAGAEHKDAKMHLPRLIHPASVSCRGGAA